MSFQTPLFLNIQSLDLDKDILDQVMMCPTIFKMSLHKKSKELHYFEWKLNESRLVIKVPLYWGVLFLLNFSSREMRVFTLYTFHKRCIVIPSIVHMKIRTKNKTVVLCILRVGNMKLKFQQIISWKHGRGERKTKKMRRGTRLIFC